MVSRRVQPWNLKDFTQGHCPQGRQKAIIVRWTAVAASTRMRLITAYGNTQTLAVTCKNPRSAAVAAYTCGNPAKAVISHRHWDGSWGSEEPGRWDGEKRVFGTYETFGKRIIDRHCQLSCLQRVRVARFVRWEDG